MYKISIKIEYIWIEEYACLRDKEFNLSLSNRFEYDKINKKIDHVKYTKRYNNFFNINNSSNNIQDIIAIVGGNGNGKTTLLKLIAEIIEIDEEYNKSDFIVVISENNTDFKIYTNIDDASIHKNSDENGLTYETFIYGYDNNIPAIADKLNLIYYSNALDNSSTIDNSILNKNIFDISTTYLMKSYNETNNSFINYIQSEYMKQIEFVTSYQNSEKHLKFNIPKEIYIDTTGIDKKIDELIEIVTPDTYYKDSDSITEDEYYNREVIVEALGSIKYKFDESIKKCVLDIQLYTKIRLVYLHLVISLYNDIKDLDFSRIGDMDQIIYFNEALDKNNIIDSCIKSGNESGVMLEYLKTESILRDIENKDHILSPLTLDYTNDTLIYDISKLRTTFKSGKSRKMEKNLKETEIQYIKSSIYDFYKLLCLNGINEDMIEIFWPLSTGEYNLLSLYSRIYEVYKSMEGENESIILLLDEGENSLHPRWQQQYVKSIINLIDDLFDNANVQIILTTHSPILLSDIPGDNVIYLDKNNKYAENLKTFGANIYDLYNNSFFLNNSVTTGVIGTFADGKIKNIIGKLNNIEKNFHEMKEANENIEIEHKEKIKSQLKEIKIVIDFMGEKVVKDILIEKYTEVEQVINKLEKKENKVEEYYKSLNLDQKKELIRLLLDEDF
ncbi:AAA family ATPase [Clostridium botulinum]|nr:AAA family ATPase [Clostridium botulinum]